MVGDMATEVRLQGNEQPPGNGSWALVTLDRSRGVPGLVDMVIHGSGATFYVTAPYGEPELAMAIQRAKEWADHNGIAHVYVQQP
jgi:hypothetical protein